MSYHVPTIRLIPTHKNTYYIIVIASGGGRTVAGKTSFFIFFLVYTTRIAPFRSRVCELVIICVYRYCAYTSMRAAVAWGSNERPCDRGTTDDGVVTV